jgi:hypothetical protein
MLWLVPSPPLVLAFRLPPLGGHRFSRADNSLRIDTDENGYPELPSFLDRRKKRSARAA